MVHVAEGERRREGSQRSAVEMQSPYVYVCMCECVNACLFEEEKECVSAVWTGFCVFACEWVGVQGQEKRDGSKGEGQNALGEGDQICGVRW